ncbi:right-handed parallel beta-helix repeat-containing protein, partial [Candidatus Woesearchaeota archaeon]|nr:right-handed parallel beta-helix repeat-containing protein [Candidatus Woesearchaeota archaeon]
MAEAPGESTNDSPEANLAFETALYAGTQGDVRPEIQETNANTVPSLNGIIGGEDDTTARPGPSLSSTRMEPRILPVVQDQDADGAAYIGADADNITGFVSESVAPPSAASSSPAEARVMVDVANCSSYVAMNSTTYNLVADITTGSSCFGAGSNFHDITFDCQGHSITGRSGLSAFEFSGTTNILVKNCNVRNFTYNVRFITCWNCAVVDSTLLNATTSGGTQGKNIDMQSVQGGSVRNVEMVRGPVRVLLSRNVTMESVGANASNIDVDSSANVTLQSSTLRSSTINMVKSSNLLVAGNNWSQSAAAIFINGSRSIIVRDNNGTSVFEGISVEYSNDSLLQHNEVTATNRNAFDLVNVINSTLANNLGISNTSAGISVTRGRSVTITDSNGTSESYVGIYIASSAASAIANSAGTSTTFVGIFLDLSNETNLTRVVGVSNSSSGIDIERGHGNRLTVSNGVSNSSAAIYMYQATDNSVINTTGQSILYPGIWLDTNASGNTLIGNNATSSSGASIYLYQASNNTFINNTAQSITWFGIMLDTGSNNNTLIDNRATSSSQRALYIFKSFNNTVIDMNATSVSFIGAQLAHSSNNTLIGTAGISNGSSLGIDLFNSSNNLFIFTTARSKGDWGLGIRFYSANNTFINTTASSNASSSLGMRVSPVGNTFINTTLSTNLGFGPLQLREAAANNTFVNLTILTNVTWIVTDAGPNNTVVDIVFQAENGSVRYSDAAELPATLALTTTNLSIGFNRVFLNSTGVSVFNSSALVTLTGLGFSNPLVQISEFDDGGFVNCEKPACERLSYAGGTIAFNVSRFTTYRVGETSDVPTCGLLARNLTLNASVASNTGCFNISTNDTTLNCSGNAIIGNGIGDGIRIVSLRGVRIVDCSITNFTNGTVIINSTTVTVDCRGRSIRGVNQGAGVFGSGSTGIDVFNCTIYNFTNAIHFTSVSSSTMRYDGLFNDTAGARIEGGTAISSSNNTFADDFNGTVANNARDLRSNTNTVTATNDAISLRDTEQAALINNSIIGSARGILLANTSALVANITFTSVTTSVHVMDNLNVTINTTLLPKFFVIENSSSGFVNFTADVDFASGVNLLDVVRLSNNFTQINSTRSPALNRTAIVAFRALSLVDPEPSIDEFDSVGFVNCSQPNCYELAYSGGVFAFNATRFSSYRAQETSGVVVCGNIAVNTTLIGTVYASGSCFNITRNDTSLNCSGRSVIGNGTGAGVAIVNLSNVQVVNCTFINFTTGVVIRNSTNTTLRCDGAGIQGNGTRDGVLAIGAVDLRVLNCSITNSTTGINLTNVTNATIGCGGFAIRGNGVGNGIYTAMSTGVDVFNCSIYNFTNAVWFTSTSYSAVRWSGLFNSSTGFRVESGLTVVGMNSTLQDDVNGSWVSSSRAVSLISNIISSVGSGIVQRDSEQSLLVNNSVSGTNGILLTNVSAAVVNSTFSITETSLRVVDNFNITVNLTLLPKFVVVENTASGIINYTDSVDFASGMNLLDIMRMSNNSAFANTTRFAQANRSAVITLRGLGFADPKPRIDAADTGSFADCTDCFELGYNGSTFIFNATHFTTYAAGESSGCGAINTNTTLNNTVIADGTCFIITRNDTTLNCSGYSVIGNGSGAAIVVQNVTNLLIGNCTLANFTEGIVARNSTNLTIGCDGATIQAEQAIVGVDVRDMLVQNCTLTNATTGINLTNATNVTVNCGGAIRGRGVGNGIYAAMSTGIDVFNCSIYNFTNAVWFTSTSYSAVRWSGLFNSTTGLRLENALSVAGANDTFISDTTAVYGASSRVVSLVVNNLSAAIGIQLRDTEQALLVNNSVSATKGIQLTNTSAILFNSTFPGTTTSVHLQDNFNVTVNLTLLPGFVVENTSSGLINYTVEVDMAAGANILDVVRLSKNFSSVNGSRFSNLNRSAVITLTGLGLTNAEPRVDALDNGTFANCTPPRCYEISYSGGVFVFNVSSFTAYAAGETPVAPSVCGNGVVEAGEECDDGASNGDCPATCNSVCRANTCGGGGGTDNPPCSDVCASGATQCSGNSVQQCVAGGRGCTVWDTVQDCGELQCQNGQCVVCQEQWQCTEWSACSSGSRTRTCTDANNCGTSSTRPSERDSCLEIVIPIPPVTEQPTIISPRGIGSVTTDTSATSDSCFYVHNSSRTRIATRLSDMPAIKLPKGFEIVKKPFSIECSGDAFDLTLNLPDNFDDLRVLKCAGGVCAEQLGRRNTTELKCGNYSQGIVRRQQLLSEQEASRLQEIPLVRAQTAVLSVDQPLASGRSSVRLAVPATVAMAAPSRLPLPQNPSLAILGAMEVRTDQPNNARIMLEYSQPKNVQPSSIALYSLKEDRWQLVGGTVDAGQRVISADVALEPGAA